MEVLASTDNHIVELSEAILEIVRYDGGMTVSRCKLLPPWSRVDALQGFQYRRLYVGIGGVLGQLDEIDVDRGPQEQDEYTCLVESPPFQLFVLDVIVLKQLDSRVEFFV